MKLGPITKLYKKKQENFKKMTMVSHRQTVTSLSYFQFMTNLKQSGSRLLDAQSVKLTFSLREAFYLTKTGNRTKNSVTHLSQYFFE